MTTLVGIQCPKAKELLRSYYPNIYTVLQQKNVHGILSQLLLGKVSKNVLAIEILS